MFTTARRVNAREALDIGLVSRVHADALGCALELVEAASKTKRRR
jgi:enoyl-CoA hydratase/carnithine racemase